jgi:hypothetical protein
MVKLTLELDGGQEQDFAWGPKGGPRFLNPKKVGLLSSIDLPLDLVAAFDAGLAASHFGAKPNASYNSAKIQQFEADLKNGGTEFIAAVGGSIVMAAIINPTAPLPFVSLVGAMPKDIGAFCLGGVSLESWASNKDRIDIVKSRLSLKDAANVALYRNPASAMAPDEAADWNLQVAPLVANIVDTTGNYNGDFNGAGGAPIKVAAATQGIVVSSDPTFQQNKNSLVAAINTWLAAAANRYVVYPLQIYSRATPAPATNSTLYGPDLYQAYYKLGQLARDASASGTYIGFEAARNLTLNM